MAPDIPIPGDKPCIAFPNTSFSNFFSCSEPPFVSSFSPDLSHSPGEIDDRWLGIDLNTTGSTVVMAEPESGFVCRLGSEEPQIHRDFDAKRRRLRRQSNVRKLRHLNNCESEMIHMLHRQIAREVVNTARALDCGIKFEEIPTAKRSGKKMGGRHPQEYSINGAAFTRLQRLVESGAARFGIPVQYVDPAHTSQLCSRCGAEGLRRRKRFDCPVCGFSGHSDENAAINIAQKQTADKQREMPVRHFTKRVVGREFSRCSLDASR